MRLDELITNLNKVKRMYGGDLQVVYGIDDEGNAFHPIHFSPSVGQFVEEESDFISKDLIINQKIDAVCVN